MLTDERRYCFHGLHTNYRTGETHDALGMLCAYLTEISPGGELKRSLCIYTMKSCRRSSSLATFLAWSIVLRHTARRHLNDPAEALSLFPDRAGLRSARQQKRGFWRSVAALTLTSGGRVRVILK